MQYSNTMVKEIKRKTKRLLEKVNGKIDFVDEVDDEDCDDLFPCAKFTICIPKSELNKVVAYESICLTHLDTCPVCHQHNYPVRRGYLVENHIITYKTLIETLIINNFSPTCNHIFLEGFTHEEDGTISVDMGS